MSPLKTKPRKKELQKEVKQLRQKLAKQTPWSVALTATYENIEGPEMEALSLCQGDTFTFTINRIDGAVIKCNLAVVGFNGTVSPKRDEGFED